MAFSVNLSSVSFMCLLQLINISLHYRSCFFPYLHAWKFLSRYRHCEFHVVGCWIKKKYFILRLCFEVELLGNSSILLGIALCFIRWTQESAHSYYFLTLSECFQMIPWYKIVYLFIYLFLYVSADQYSIEYLWGIAGFLCAALAFLVLCPVNSSNFGLPELSAVSLQLRDSTGLHLGSPCLPCGLEILSRK